MNSLNTLITTKEYGNVKVTLKNIMDSKNISRYNLARSINARFEVIDRWYNGNVEKIDLDIAARICYVLNCKIEDILHYENEKND